jgi:Exostosin family
MLLNVKRHIEQTYPFWNRSKGRDHIWLANHDEGACWFPSEIYQNSIILTHWGRMDDNHKSGTAYDWDNYTNNNKDINEWNRGDWRVIYQGHPCYNPSKDLVIPAFKWPSHYKNSPLLGAVPAKERNILLYFKGDIGEHRLKWYSRGIRQRLHAASEVGNWSSKYQIFIGSKRGMAEGYSEWLIRSKFCLVAPGDGWSSRAEDAVLHGCIPLVIMDEVHAIYESILDWDMFSVRIKEKELERVPEVSLRHSTFPL